MIQELRKNDIKIARCHESGDFYNQIYLNKWIDIWKATPDIKYLAFTKSFHLDFSEVPQNVAIYNSVDSTTYLKSIHPLEAFPFAKTIDTKKDLPTGYRYCGPIGKDRNGKKDPTHYHLCGDKCKFCWEKRTNVAWPKH